MKLAVFEINNSKRLGIVSKEYVIDLNKAFSYFKKGKDKRLAENLLDFIEKGEEALKKAEIILDYVASKNYCLEDAVFNLNEVSFKQPIFNPPKIICIGLNYEDYRRILGLERLEVPSFFLKASSTLIGHEDTIFIPRYYGSIFHEWELAVIISKKCKNVPKEKFEDVIFGYTIFHDITAHDLEMIKGRRYQQWAKNIDTFGPLGPWVVTKDELKDKLYNLRMIRRRNGKVECESSTKYMSFHIDEIISFLSTFITLEPGTIISLGSPPTGPISDGDVIETEIEGIGILRNYVKEVDVQLRYAKEIGLLNKK
ncbi:MAG: fumarylacetoacetate hydrolase family protein [Candidatus Methanomethylicaceae archaeon]